MPRISDTCLYRHRLGLAVAVVASLFIPMHSLSQNRVVASGGTSDKAFELRQNVVRILGENSEIGFGFIVAERSDGVYVVTAQHVALPGDPDAPQSRLKVIFYSDQGNSYGATVVQHNRAHDLALVRVDQPPKVAWRKDCLAGAEEEKRGTLVLFIGRGDRWDVPGFDGVISSLGVSAERWLAADLFGIGGGSSGAPLVTKTGIIGMIKGDNEGATQVLSIEFIRDAMREWDVPWQLSVGGTEVARVPDEVPRGPAPTGRLFSMAVPYRSGGGKPNSVAVGDFDGDGKLDVAVANSETNNIGILLGNGDGTFREAHTYPAGDTPYAIRVGDFNHDGNLDLAVTNVSYSGTNPTVSILLGNGDGTFQAPRNVRAGNQPTDLALGDFKRDGKLDIAVASRVSPELTVLLGNGDGWFGNSAKYAVKQLPLYAVAVGDMNDDGKQDIVVGDHHYISVLLGNGDGTFAEAQNYLANTGDWGAYSVAIGDFNGDGKSDVAVANFSGNSIGLLLGNGDGSLQSPRTFSTDPGPFLVAAGDFNRDGKLDLVTANNAGTVSVLLGNGDGSFQSTQNYRAGASPCSVAIGDFNGDGKPDLAVADRAGDVVTILLNVSGDSAITLSSSSNPSSIGAPVTFTVIVPARLGTDGVVQFKSDHDFLGTMPLVNGSASIVTAALLRGSHAITAVYTSSSSAHVSATLTQTVR